MKKGINKYKKNFRYISPICPEARRGRICTKFGTAVGVADVITSNKFFGDRSRGMDSVGVENCRLPLTRQAPLTQGWRYRYRLTDFDEIWHDDAHWPLQRAQAYCLWVGTLHNWLSEAWKCTTLCRKHRRLPGLTIEAHTLVTAIFYSVGTGAFTRYTSRPYTRYSRMSV